jgi:uncharacterized protein with GYD domain
MNLCRNCAGFLSGFTITAESVKLEGPISVGGTNMAKYLVQASYTADGLKGLQTEGAAGRVQSANKVAETLGGKCDGFYWAFGERDVVAIFDLPNSVSAAALAFAVSASGLIRTTTTPLLTASEADEALKKSVSFRPPGR